MVHKEKDKKIDPFVLLGISTEAKETDLRKAYLKKVKEFPPDRFPEEFERIRDAYEILRDPFKRTSLMMIDADPKAPLVSLLDGSSTERRFLGPEPWLKAIRKK